MHVYLHNIAFAISSPPHIIARSSILNTTMVQSFPNLKLTLPNTASTGILVAIHTNRTNTSGNGKTPMNDTSSRNPDNPMAKFQPPYREAVWFGLWFGTDSDLEPAWMSFPECTPRFLAWCCYPYAKNGPLQSGRINGTLCGVMMFCDNDCALSCSNGNHTYGGWSCMRRWNLVDGGESCCSNDIVCKLCH